MPTPLTLTHRMLRTRLWQATAVTFGVFLLDMFVLQQGPFFTDLFLFVFGATMVVDGYASILEQRFQYFGLTMTGRFAQIAGGIIVMVGAVLTVTGFSSLVF